MDAQPVVAGVRGARELRRTAVAQEAVDDDLPASLSQLHGTPALLSLVPVKVGGTCSSVLCRVLLCAGKPASVRAHTVTYHHEVTEQLSRLSHVLLCLMYNMLDNPA